MRKVSYTQMRAELSDILDAIRNGETVVVTQRGRPDTVLNGSLVEPGQIPLGHAISSRTNADKEYTVIVERGSKSVKPHDSRDEAGNWKAMWEKRSSHLQVYTGKEVRAMMKKSFEDALNQTQTKHAKIIKALEDK